MEQLISFETSKIAKEKGFNESVIDWWEKDKHGSWREEYPESYDFGYGTYNEYDYKISRPTQSLLQKWLRDDHKLNISVDVENNKFSYFIARFGQVSLGKPTGWGETDEFDSYEEALEKALVKALKLIK